MDRSPEGGRRHHHGQDRGSQTSEIEPGEARAVFRCRTGGLAEDPRDKRLTGHLNKYYDEVIKCIRNAASILIMGPGEAKIELEARLGKAAPRTRIVEVETADKMTDRQIAARVRQRFLEEQ